MKNSKLITSGREVSRRPATAFLLSLLFTGAGQLYCGCPSRGTAMLLMRTIPLLALPLHVALTQKSSYLFDIISIIIFCSVVAIASPLEAFINLRGKKRHTAFRPGPRPACFLPVFYSIKRGRHCILSPPVRIAGGLFPLQKTTAVPLLFESGDIVLLMEQDRPPTRGEMIPSTVLMEKPDTEG